MANSSAPIKAPVGFNSPSIGVHHPSFLSPTRLPDIATRLQRVRMTEDKGSPISSSVRRRCDEPEDAKGSPKRVKVDTQSTVDVNSLKPGSDLQGDKKPQKRRDAGGYPKSRRGKGKDNKNVGRRRGNRPEVNEARPGPSETDPQDLSDKSPRLPKRQSAILLGFCGTGCAGMQMLVSSRSTTVSMHPTTLTDAFFL